MSIISGRIDGDGAIVGVLVGVSANREAVLHRLGMPVPATVPLRLLIDTGSFLTGLPAEVFARLGLTAVYQAAVRTPSTRPGQPFLPDIYDVAVGLASGISVSVLPSVQVLCSPDYRMDEPVNGILGRDVLDLCHFEYRGPSRYFELAF